MLHERPPNMTIVRVAASQVMAARLRAGWSPNAAWSSPAATTASHRRQPGQRTRPGLIVRIVTL
jgi:hypothetical protein